MPEEKIEGYWKHLSRKGVWRIYLSRGAKEKLKAINHRLYEKCGEEKPSQLSCVLLAYQIQVALGIDINRKN